MFLQVRRKQAQTQQQRSQEQIALIAALRDAVLKDSEATSETPVADGTLRQIELLEARLSLLEGRFPEDATLDKLSSVNDAILATKLEEMQRSIERIEQSAIKPTWVFTTVLAVIAALFAIASLIPWVVGQFQNLSS